MLRRCIPLAVLALAACGGDAPEAAGGVSAGEAEALEDAADMLDERRLPPEALPPEASLPDESPAATPQPQPENAG